MVKRTDTQAGINTLKYAERQYQALELRKAGVSYEVIAQRLGYENASGPQKAVTKALTKMVQAPADEVRLLELARLDAMLFSIWQRVKAGNDYAIDRALKIMDRRSAYLGLDAPKEIKVAHEMQAIADRMAGDMGLNTADILAEAERIVTAAGVTN